MPKLPSWETGNEGLRKKHMQFNLIYDAAALAAPASFRAGIQQAATLLDAAISDPITVNIQIDYSGTGGGAAGGPDNVSKESYSSIRADLIKNATPGDTTFNTLPTGPSIQGKSQVIVWNAELKVLGLLAPNDTTTDDGSCTFNTDIAPNSLIATALHELTHAMGRVPYGPQPDIFDFFRFTAPGTYLFSNANTAPPAYFSVDGGITKLADYGQTSDPSDFLNTGVQGNDPFNEFGSINDLQQLTTVDLKQMDALGFNLTAPVASLVTAVTIQNDYLGITRTALPPNQATMVANAIYAGTQTETQYVNGVLSQVANTTIPAVAVEATMYNATGTSAEITSLTTNFLPAQVANATHYGLNPQVYACEALGLVYAFGNETGSVAFANNFGPNNAALPNSTAGDAAFAAAASTTIFGSASTANLVSVLKGFISNWETFFTANGVPGLTNPSAALIDLAARGASWGDMVGVALANNLGPLNGQAINFLDDVAQGRAVYGASLVGQPAHQPFQGA
jgi:hypothetical protein